MYDISAAKWDSKLLSYAGIKSDMLPYVMPTGSYIGDVVSSVARELGIPNSVRVYNGAHDQYCAAIGSGALDTGDMLLSTGTTWVVLGITDKLVYTKSGISPGIYPAGGYGAMGSIISSGASLKWLRNNLVEDDYKVIDKMAAERMKDAENVFFVPFLAGAGFPDFDIDVAAGIYGLRLDNNKYDVALALMEGVAFEAKTALSEFKNSGCPIERLTMIGGASRSSLWPKITGYITECEISVMDQTEACACGAALIAAVGSGIFADYRSATSVISPKHVIDTSDTEIRDFYRKKYERYVKISDVFRTFNKI